MPIATPAIRVLGLTRKYGEHVALEPLDLELAAGTMTGLIGPNGSGKTTFLRMLCGLVPSTAGTVEIDGVRLAGDGTNVRRRSAFCPGELGFYPELTCRRHLRWSMRGRPAADLARAYELAERLGLPIEQRVRSFSHGMKRQMLFAASLAADVPVRILDEPTEGLDPTKRGVILDILEEAVARGDAVLLSSHHLGEVDRSCERLLFLERGRLIGDEDAEDLATRSRRLVRIAWPDAESAARARPLVEPLAHSSVRWEGAHASLLLERDDPREFLGRLAQLDQLPAPVAVDYGRLSLAELYRDLYGVEGL